MRNLTYYQPFHFFVGGITMNEYYALMDSNKVKLAAAYAILENNGESILLRTFDDALKLAYRAKIVENLIEDEEESEEKKKIEEDIRWLKKCVRNGVKEKKKFYASVIAGKYAKAGEFSEMSERVLVAIDNETEYDFYDWISQIESTR